MDLSLSAGDRKRGKILLAFTIHRRHALDLPTTAPASW